MVLIPRDDDKDLTLEFCDWVNGNFDTMHSNETEIYLHLAVANAALKELTGKGTYESLTFGDALKLTNHSQDFADHYEDDDLATLRELDLRKKQWAILITALGECYQSHVDVEYHDEEREKLYGASSLSVEWRSGQD
jgi:hypothetical protein